MNVKHHSHHILNIYNIKQSIFYSLHEADPDYFSSFYNLQKYNSDIRPVLIINNDIDSAKYPSNHKGLIYQIIFDNLPININDDVIYLITNKNINNRPSNSIDINVDDYLDWIKNAESGVGEVTFDYHIFNRLNIYNIYVSKSYYTNIATDFFRKYNLSVFTKYSVGSLLVVGVADQDDYSIIDQKRSTDQLYILWTGQVISNVTNFDKIVGNNIINLAIDMKALNTLSEHGIKGIHYMIDLYNVGQRIPKTLNSSVSSKTKVFEFYGIQQIYISPSISHLNHIADMYSLDIYNPLVEAHTDKPLLVFGLFTREDIKLLITHKSTIYLMWAGIDCDDSTEQRKNLLQQFQLKYPSVKHFAISTDIKNKLAAYKIQSDRINVDLTDHSIFNDRDVITTNGNTIYIFNGMPGTHYEKLYGEQLYLQLQCELPQFSYILSNKMTAVSPIEMYNIYKTCFIGIRLSKHDGLATMVSEMLSMKIPVIHNGDHPNAIKWSDIDSIKRKIMSVYNRNSFCKMVDNYSLKNAKYTYDFYNNTRLSHVDNSHINDNLTDFLELVRGFNNILIISADYPGYGGGASNADYIQDFLTTYKHNTYAIYYNYPGDTRKRYYSTAKYCVVDKNMVCSKIKNLHFVPDLVILKSAPLINLADYLDCPIIFCIGGIFLNSLDRHSYTLTCKEDLDKHINNDVIRQAKMVDLCLCNSIHTSAILSIYYNISSKIFYSSFVGYYNKLPVFVKDLDFNHRYFIFGIIVSDFTRKIKNIDGCIGFISSKGIPVERIILIGYGSSKYKSSGYVVYENMDHAELIQMYSNIQYVIQDSFYESCSNVMIEAFYAGCRDRMDYLDKNVNISKNSKEFDTGADNDSKHQTGNIEHKATLLDTTEHNTKLLDNTEHDTKLLDTTEHNTKLLDTEDNTKLLDTTEHNTKLLDNTEHDTKLLDTEDNTTLLDTEISESLYSDYLIYNSIKLDTKIETSKQDDILIKRPLISINDDPILLISTQYAYYGGAATLVYELHKKLLDSGVNSCCLFLNTKRISEKNYNPKGYSAVYSKLLVDHNRTDLIEFYADFIDNVKPKYVIGFNYIAPIIGKKMYPDILTYYYITGSKYISDSNITASEYINRSKRFLDEINIDENYCMNLVDYIIPNSYLTRNIFTKCYPHIIHKLTSVTTFEEIFFTNKINDYIDKNRPYDIAVISSRFDRSVKNLDFIRELYKNPLLKNYTKICIGKGSIDAIPDAQYHFGLVSIDEVNSILSKTRILIITSKYESLSISLIQGINNGCIVLSNNNVGGSIYLDTFYIMTNFNTEMWSAKIDSICQGYEYHLKMFKSHNKEIDLTRTLNSLISTNINITRKNVIFVSVDKPHDGGASCNVINMMNCFTNNRHIFPIGLFIVNDLLEINTSEYLEKNIYFCVMNKNIEENIHNVLNQIRDRFGKLSLFFVKNYKAFTCLLREVSPEQVLYSPSGLRMVSTLSTYYQYNDINSFVNNGDEHIEFDTSLNLYEFIQKYDVKLEKYIFGVLKYIMPNSDLTFDIINRSYDVANKLYPFINITYIDYDYSKIENTNWLDREYDLVFCSYSWKRKVKNYGFFVDLISKLNKIHKYRILIIGINQRPIIKCNNVETISHIDHSDLLVLFRNVKLFCMNSFYDSSPNTLKEAIQAGCQVLLTKNIGNFTMFNTSNIVENPENIEEWITKISDILKLKKLPPHPLKNGLKTNFVPLFLQNMILSIIDNQNRPIIGENDNAGFYKLHSSWDGNIVDGGDKLTPMIKSNQIGKSLNVQKIIDTDLFYLYFTKYFTKFDYSKNNHYVVLGSDDNLEYSNIKLYYPFMPDNIYIWTISKNTHLELFRKCARFFFRGNNYLAFNNLSRDKYSEVYCATSLFQDKYGNITAGKIIDYSFDKVLVEEDNYGIFVQKFHKSGVTKYLKSPSTFFMATQNFRKFDYIFVATELQPTKNRNLLQDFILYCERQKIIASFIMVGKHDQHFNEKLITNNLNYTKYYNFEHLEPADLCTLYNNTKVNLMFSGRDALPRVVLESLACGCYNVALDSITDGKFLYREPMGSLLSFPELGYVYNSSTKSICYKSDDCIFDKLIQYKYRVYDHFNISYTFHNFLESYKESK